MDNKNSLRPVSPLVRLFVAVADVYRRFLGAVLGIAGPQIAYAMMAAPARWLYRLFDPIRQASEAQCAAALAGRVAPSQVRRIAEEGFVHRIWNLADLMLADRLLHPGTFHRYCSPIPDRYLAMMRSARERHHPIILLTAYYSSFDLLPVFLGYNGIRPGIVYRTHDNPVFDAYRRRIRGRSGCELIPVDRAAGRIERILAEGGTIALVADHHAEKAGEPVTFLGLPTRAMRSAGLLAWRYEAGVVVAGIRRLDRAFRFEIVIEDCFGPADWRTEPDPVRYVTGRYLAGLERLILAAPAEYLWAYPRWGEELLRGILNEASPVDSPPRPTAGR